MLRAALVGTTLAAILLRWALWNPPVRPGRAPSSPDLPDRVFGASYQDHLPFGCPSTRSCCGDGNEMALLVQSDAIWMGMQWPPGSTPMRIARDGREWKQLEAALRAESPDRYRDFQVAASDDASYEDLLIAMLTARASGYYPRVITPALPVYPNHGHGGGMPPSY